MKQFKEFFKEENNKKQRNDFKNDLLPSFKNVIDELSAMYKEQGTFKITKDNQLVNGIGGTFFNRTKKQVRVLQLSPIRINFTLTPEKNNIRLDISINIDNKFKKEINILKFKKFVGNKNEVFKQLIKWFIDNKSELLKI